MTLGVKVDEDLPRAVVQMLRDAGYGAVGVIEQGMGDGKTLSYGKPFNPRTGSSSQPIRGLPISDCTHLEPTGASYCYARMKTAYARSSN